MKSVLNYLNIFVGAFVGITLIVLLFNYVIPNGLWVLYALFGLCWLLLILWVVIGYLYLNGLQDNLEVLDKELLKDVDVISGMQTELDKSNELNSNLQSKIDRQSIDITKLRTELYGTDEVVECEKCGSIMKVTDKRYTCSNCKSWKKRPSD